MGKLAAWVAMCYLQYLSDNGISDSDHDLPDPVFNVSLSPPNGKGDYCHLKLWV